MHQHKLPIPYNWDDLLKPVYSGHIGITSPSRSGTTHLIVEMFLQTYGWDKGWAMLSKLGGNLSTVTARSFGVASGVAQRRFGIGITIDFLASSQDAKNGENVFIMPADAAYIPASIAILKDAKNVANAEKFVDFIFSENGQKILRLPTINRIPVLARLNGDLLPKSASRGLMQTVQFNPDLSAERYGLVNLIFDDFIVRRRATLVRLWKKIAELEARQRLDAQSSFSLEQARQLLSKPPLIVYDAVQLNEALKAEWPRSVARTSAQDDFARQIRHSVEHNLLTVEKLLSSVSPVIDDLWQYR
ncbi:spermidine/putrescine-binding protein [Paenochrobactrum gallinarii]|uniref:Spermidine/putrescine-binding protein n=1 Tax=Paenochrobactrum gallinarii TaxID=643673 RepID=A0A841M3K9_9HYPH|nr:extracellular solute-binding protein [Paenochrobactrum gallinarii]MBB6262359.1 spermidine/putrescine-binding protein [Paenochrobactrum gallinarii]